MNQNRQDIGEHLLLQYLQGNADEELRRKVETWLDAGSGNRKQLDRLEALWLETGKISPAPVVVDLDAAWLKVSTRLDAEEKQCRTIHGKADIYRFRLTWYILAAALIVILFGIFGVYMLTMKPVGQIEMISDANIRQDSLPDGTAVTLNHNSKLVLAADFKDGHRNVRLTGEAFFQVMHDAAHPFVVDAGRAGIRVLGTSFGVKVNPAGGVEVTVREGRVLLFAVDQQSGDSATLFLNAGESGIFPAGASVPVMAGSVMADGLFWADRSLDFRNVALSDVFRLLEKQYGVRITVSDLAVLDCRLTASFVNEPASNILTVIAGSFGLYLETSGQNFHLTGHGCGK
jgi:ferric-dicitrate binding protein FerR (iron transport regulator)